MAETEQLPPPVASPTEEKAKPLEAAAFVANDTDRPLADENVSAEAPPPPEPEKKERGRPRSEAPSKDALRMRAAYAKKKAERAPPPSFADLPGGAKPVGMPAEQPTAIVPGKTVNYRQNAECLVSVCTYGASKMLGDQWLIKEDGEKEQICSTLASYMEYKKWDDLSPGFALFFVLGAYVASRWEHEETQKRVKKFFDKLSGRKEPERPVYPNASGHLERPQQVL